MPWNHTISNFKNCLPSPRGCFIIGATGEVGKCLVKEILSSSAFDKVIVVTRRSLNYDGPNKDILVERIVEDFGTLEAEHVDILDGCQFGFYSLGTTMAKAGSQENFRKIDHDYTISLGKLAKNSGCRWFGLVSSAGASKTSPFFYLRTKGEIESDMQSLDIPHLFIYRPGHLLCKRSERRFGEYLVSWVMPAINFVTRGSSAIKTDTVAKAMVIDALESGIAEAKGERVATVKVIPNRAMDDSVKLAGLV